MWLRSGFIGAVLLGSLAGVAAAQEPASGTQPGDRVEMLKQSFVASKTALRQYEWIETVAMSLSGEEKVRQQFTCYYGADGALQKVPVAADAKEAQKRGVRGKVADNKKAEIQASLKSATALLALYVPLDPAKIQAAKAAGNVSVSLPGADGSVTVTIKNYLKPGDEVAARVDAAKNTLQAVTISTFDDSGKEKSPVTGNVTYAALGDGTLFPAKQALGISSQNLKIDVQNSGYRKRAQ